MSQQRMMDAARTRYRVVKWQCTIIIVSSVVLNEGSCSGNLCIRYLLLIMIQGVSNIKGCETVKRGA